jgi:transglutaminase-like putative cysteine protease
MNNLIKPVLLPCLLSFITAVSFFCVYEPTFLPIQISAIFVGNLLLHLLYEKLRVYNKKWFTTIIIIVILISSIFIAVRLVLSQGRDAMMQLDDWFFKVTDEDLHFPYFIAAFTIMYTFFISSTVFYFTNVRYNSFFVMLTCMTTFALYAKTFTNIPFIFPSLIIALILLISIEKRWYKSFAQKAIDYKKFIAAGVCFVSISAYIAGLFPPVEDTPYREQFDAFVSGGATRLLDLAGFSMDSNMSGRAGNTNHDEVVLFHVSFDANNSTVPDYLRRQVFDNWEHEYWEHYSDDTWSGVYVHNHNWQQLTGNIARIYIATDVPIRYFPVPPGVSEVSIPLDSSLAKTIRNEFFIAGERVRGASGISYTVAYNGETYAPFTCEEYDEYMNSTLQLPDYHRQGQVQQLAREITQDYTTDFDKALAIEQYFHNRDNGFTYDLNFRPQSKAVDYFLFDTKIGTCSDFATAMTILAREAGLYARYVEGYVLEEQVDSGYIVRVKHSHAFTEIYLPDTGWTIFEPTIAGAQRERISYATILTILICTGIAAIAAVLFIVFAVPVIKERRFRKTARNSVKDKQVQLIYNKIYLHFMSLLRLSERTLSSHDMNNFAAEKYSLKLHELTENYDRVIYGGIPAVENDYFATYMEFVELVCKGRR